MKPSFKPKKHQEKTLKFGDKTTILADFSDPGTGKTGSEIWLFDKRRKKDGHCALVIAPKSLLKSAWADDFRKFAPHLKTVICPAEKRLESLNAKADVYIINTDGVKALLKMPKTWWDKFDTLIVDESTAFKHHTSQRSKALGKICQRFKYRSILTGTPNSKSITDVWHQIFVLDGGKRLGPSFYSFRATVCEPKQVGRDPNAIQWTDKDGAEEAVFGLLKDIVIRHNLDDCEDIPKTHIYTKNYELTERQLKVYRQMEEMQIAEVPERDREAFKAWMKGEEPKFKVITAINAAAVRTKLLQIASGAVYSGADKYELIDSFRYEMVADLVLERNKPLVFYLWKHQRDELTKQFEKNKLRYAVIDGDASDKMRAKIVEDYQAGMYDVVLAHPLSAAHGLTFTAGNSIIWPSPTDNLEWFVQGNRRQRRIGQKLKTEVITLLAEGTVEDGVYGNLGRKDKRMTNLLELFE